jgi:hypothetical protein
MAQRLNKSYQERFQKEREKKTYKSFDFRKPLVSTGSSEQAGLHDLLEPDALKFKVIVARPGAEIQHLAKAQVHSRKGLRQHEVIPAVKIPSPVGRSVDWYDNSPGGSGQADRPRLDDSCRTPRPVHDVSGKTRSFQVTDHLFQGSVSIA